MNDDKCEVCGAGPDDRKRARELRAGTPPAIDATADLTKQEWESVMIVDDKLASQRPDSPADLVIGEKLVPYEQRHFHDEKTCTDLGYKVIGRYVKLDASQRPRKENAGEWTGDRVERCLANHGAEGLADIINAELDAEREQVKHYEAANKTLLELAADDKQQLLAALAAIAELKQFAIAGHRNVEHGDYYCCRYCQTEWRPPEQEHHESRCPLSTDLSALDALKAEVRKPLVRLVEAAYKEGRDDGYDSVSATDEYNEERWRVSSAKHELDALTKEGK
jgi:hypothetical protein